MQNHSYKKNEFNLNVNETSFSYETRFEKEAKGN